MKISKLAGMIFSLLLCVYHFFTFISYSREHEIEKNLGLPSEGSFILQLSTIHLALLFSLMVFLVASFGTKLIWKIVSAIGVFFTLGIYYCWYFEKYLYLEAYGLRIGTVDYEKWLKEIGIFRGATELDYLAFIVTVSLAFYTACKITYDLLGKKLHLK